MAKSFFLILTLLLCCYLKSTVHIFGDSHALFSFCNADRKEYGFWKIDYQGKLITVPFHIHWLGPITMHRVGRDGIQFLDVRNYQVKENDIAVFAFGEIDARCHIGRQRDEKLRSLDEIIETLCQNYINTIQQNKNLYHTLTCIIFNIIPPTNKLYNPMYPYYGTLEDRVTITLLLNNKLEEMCTRYKFKFLDIYNIYMKQDGSLNSLLSDGGVHINVSHNYFIKEKLITLLDSEFLNELRKFILSHILKIKL